MGTWTAWEYHETFGGWPEPDDHSIVPSLEGADIERKRRLEEGNEVILPDDHPGFVPCRHCKIGVRADLFKCPACGAET